MNNIYLDNNLSFIRVLLNMTDKEYSVNFFFFFFVSLVIDSDAFGCSSNVFNNKTYVYNLSRVVI